ncbi:VanZ family protein [Thermosipho atlanticus]|uniref:VanZ like family protein n=1 Tax=Thermosipho atlanticus DSM 15807 TaxID=1123380 RepID=A0A1M5T7L4_9BACT|nr:VanZ family protein [Thermosipho atlanticus]SHH46704.1 VanZ like family protein [Thermosipho atlanticus DSM 15807]
MNNKVNYKIIVIFLVLILWIFLIFYFSSRSPVKSSQQSSFVTNILRKIDQAIDFSNTALFRKLELYIKKMWFKTQYVPAEMLVRKTAHFGLYFILGFLSFIGFSKITKVYIALLLGITFPNFIAVIDEYSQQYYNRGSSLNDVIIDLSGIIFGVLFAFLLLLLFEKFIKYFHKRYKKKSIEEDG